MSIFTRRKPDHAEQEREDRTRLAAEIATARAVLAHYQRGAQLHFGAPTKCPRCGDYGFVRAVNRSRGVSHLDCFGCHAEWVISVAALKAIEDEPVPVPVGIGTLAPQPPNAASELPASTPTPTPSPVPTAAPAPSVVTPDPVTIVIDQPAPAPYGDHPSIRPVAPSIGTGPVAPLHPRRPAAADGTEMRVLCIEDNPFDVAVLEELIGGLPQGSVALRHVATLADGLERALYERVDVVLLDLGLPDSSGIATLLEWQLGSTTSAPVIVMTGDRHPDTVREAQLLGAAQFVHKQHIADLVNCAGGSAKLLRLLQTTTAASRHHTQDA
jgi:CheY-like chemotaxis protein